MFKERAAIFSFKIIAYLLGPISFLSCLAGSIILFPNVKSQVVITLIFFGGAIIGFCAGAFLLLFWARVVMGQLGATHSNELIDSLVSKDSPVAKFLKWQIKLTKNGYQV